MKKGDGFDMKILMIDIDTLRPDHMGCYGYGRNTTPNMDQVAAEAVRFENYYCSDAPCLPSRASLVTGMFGIRNGVVGHGGTGADRRLTGAGREFVDQVDNGFHNIFRRAGMYTASVSTFPERHSAWWFNAGFNETYNQGERGNESGERVLPYALKWLDDNGTQRENWFLHVHFWDPHTPYRAPAEFGNPFENSPIDDIWITDNILSQHKKAASPHGANEINMYDDAVNPAYPRHPGRVDDQAGLKKLIDGYDCGIAYADLLIGKLFSKMKELGIYEDSAIIITSDHGENIGELALYAEHGTADHTCCHIPMVLKWPGAKAGHVDRELHYSLDLLPTICELLEVSANGSWDGKSFANTVRYGEKQGRNSLVLSQMAHVCQRSARFGDWLYMRTYHDGFHLFDREMLFCLRDDPYEQYDVKEEHPEICAQGAKIILDWHDDAMAKVDDCVDPMWRVLQEGGPYHTWGHLDDYCRRLEETGRADQADALRRRHGSGQI